MAKICAEEESFIAALTRLYGDIPRGPLNVLKGLPITVHFKSDCDDLEAVKKALAAKEVNDAQ